jgi:ATP-binding cassette subfamily B protein
MYHTVQSGMASAERVFELLDGPEEAPDGGPELAPPDGRGRVEFRRVSFSYRPGTPVINDLSLVAEPGSTVAIVGPAGAGKTTLVNLLMRFYEIDSGAILIDGVDIASVSRRSLRSRIGMVLRDAWLFDGTIAENVAYGPPGAGPDEVVAAARTAHLDQFVRTLPEGYSTQLSTQLHNNGGDISAASGSSSPSRGRCFPARSCWSSTRRPVRSTAAPSCSFGGPSPTPNCWPGGVPTSA